MHENKSFGLVWFCYISWSEPVMQTFQPTKIEQGRPWIWVSSVMWEQGQWWWWWWWLLTVISSNWGIFLFMAVISFNVLKNQTFFIQISSHRYASLSPTSSQRLLSTSHLSQSLLVSWQWPCSSLLASSCCGTRGSPTRPLQVSRWLLSCLLAQESLLVAPSLLALWQSCSWL